MSIEALEMICAKCRGNEWGPDTPRKEILAWFHDFAAAAIEQAERQEPYAWEFAGTIFHDKDEVFGWWNSDKDVSDTPPLALYTAPPQQEKQEPTAAMIQALTEQYDSDRAIGIGFNPQTLCRAVLAVQRQPLTEEEMLAILVGIDAETKRLPSGMKAFARAIERAHGIGGGHD